jgi:anthranilate/para-aminobenzoate synthase component I
MVLVQPREVFNSHSISGDPLRGIQEILSRFALCDTGCPLPFYGGLAGLLSYELKNHIERKSISVADPYGIPDIHMAFYDCGIVLDHQEKTTSFFYLARVQDTREEEFQRIQVAGSGILREWVRRLSEFKETVSEKNDNIRLHSTQNKKSFEQAVARAKQYIRSGDIFQANLSHAMQASFDGDAWRLYDKQVSLNPTCFSAFADFGDYQIVSGSPERLVRTRHGKIDTRPIAGTRPRSGDANRDHELSRELMVSAKERAEHVMLLDLERNDLGRVCEYGSVRVTEQMVLENYSHVRHIVSEVQGQLRRDVGPVDVIRAVFPGGTITGAPKVRAMQIIDELEQRARGPYTGSLGYIGLAGEMDFNIVIRSLVIQDHQLYLQVGAGIVADSDPEREYEETIHKAQAFLEVLRASENLAPSSSCIR